MKQLLLLFSLLLIPGCQTGTDHATDIPTGTTSFEECSGTDYKESHQNLNEQTKAAVIDEEIYQREQKKLAETLIGPMPAENKKKTSNKKKNIIPTDRSISLDASINASDRLALQK